MNGEAEALNGMGEASQGLGELGEASAQHALALELARQVGDRYEQARAHRGLASSSRAGADDARAHAAEALRLYTELDTPEAAEVRAWLSARTADAS